MTENNNKRGHEAVSEVGNSLSELHAAHPDCYRCKHRRGLVYSAHSRCVHPCISNEQNDGEFNYVMGSLISLLNFYNQGTSPLMKRMNISGTPHGVKNGWFNWPLDFDPIWLESCDRFEEKADD